jgi:hypothetical protein
MRDGDGSCFAVMIEALQLNEFPEDANSCNQSRKQKSRGVVEQRVEHRNHHIPARDWPRRGRPVPLRLDAMCS